MVAGGGYAQHMTERWRNKCSRYRVITPDRRKPFIAKGSAVAGHNPRKLQQTACTWKAWCPDEPTELSKSCSTLRHCVSRRNVWRAVIQTPNKRRDIVVCRLQTELMSNTAASERQITQNMHVLLECNLRCTYAFKRRSKRLGIFIWVDKRSQTWVRIHKC